MLADRLGSESLKSNPEETSKQFRQVINKLKSNPQLASRIDLHLKRFEDGGPPSKEAVSKLMQSRNLFESRLQKENETIKTAKRKKERMLKYDDSQVSLDSLFKEERADSS